MPLNIAIVFLLTGGWLFSRLFAKAGLPAVVGMVAWGIVVGSFFRELLPDIIFQLEPFLKSFALIVILLRAGMALNKKTLTKIGSTAALMTLVPCLLEGSVLTIVFHFLFGFNWAVAGLTGFMLAAVSPAVIVPSMLKLKHKGLGKENEVPTTILAGASADDVLAITIFTVFLQTALGGDFTPAKVILTLLVSLFLGLVPGIAVGYGLLWFFRKQFTSIRATEKALILLMISIVLVQVGNWAHSAALIGVMAVGFVLLENEEKVAHELAQKMSKIWVIAELILFVLIGISLDLHIAWSAGLLGSLAIFIGLIFRSIGVAIATAWSGFNAKERLFCIIAYLPKATVQAALGGVALANGIEHGNTILAIAVLSIVLTAPLGLIGIRFFGKSLLSPTPATP